MGMTIDDCIHKLDFSISAYQKLIDENVSKGEVVGTGVRGTWTASTPLNKAYSDMIEAFRTAKDALRQMEQKQRWIKCSDNLPDMNVDILGTIKDSGEVVKVTRMTYRLEDLGWKWVLSDDVESNSYHPYEIIAWMPLPKPYSEVEE